MKKALLALCLLFAITGVNFAQTTKEVAKKENGKKGGGPNKKDGTPDMRYKKNQAAADTAKIRKKDGTPDKRYKKNQAPAGDTTKRWKKDGAGDKKWKANQAPAGDTTKRWKKDGAGDKK